MDGVSPKIAFIYPSMPQHVYAPCLKFSAVNNTVSVVFCTGFIGIPDDGHQYVCTLSVFSSDGVDLLRDEERNHPAFFPINPDMVNKESGVTFVKSEASIIADKVGYYHILCTLYSQGFGEELHVNESWFYIDVMVDVK